MIHLTRHLPDVIATGVGMVLLLIVGAWILRRPLVRSSSVRRRLALLAIACGYVLLLAGLLSHYTRVGMRLTPFLVVWIGTAALSLNLGLALVCVLGAILWLIPRARPEHNPARRTFLTVARGAVLAAPAAAAGYAVFIQRCDFTPREIELPIANLPRELEGLRLVQLSDIHLSPFLSERELARAVDMANEFRPHLSLVTGDLITSARDPLDRCIRQLARLRAEAGAIGCMGNHEVYAKAQDEAELQAARVGIEFLRSENRVFTFRGKSLNFAGVDYQPMKSPYLVGTESLLRAGMPNILLSHNPDVFPVAAGQGWDATLSGHTHGGQINVEILHRNLNVARFYTPYVYGLYREGKSSIYVTRGIGTVGLPVRLGAPPEVTLIRLCAI